jgi:soluble lytic murein transglycosylase-like protein
MPMTPIPFLACMVAVGNLYGLPPRALPAIQAVEGGAPGVVHHNSNGSDDLGVMQVNTRWVIPLAEASGLPPIAVWSRLVGDPCFNITAAGAILRIYLDETHDNVMRAVGNYHSHTPVLNRKYQREVLAAARRLFAATDH